MSSVAPAENLVMAHCDPHMGFDTFKYAVLQGRITDSIRARKDFQQSPGARFFRFSSLSPTGTNLTSRWVCGLLTKLLSHDCFAGGR